MMEDSWPLDFSKSLYNKHNLCRCELQRRVTSVTTVIILIVQIWTTLCYYYLFLFIFLFCNLIWINEAGDFVTSLKYFTCQCYQFCSVYIWSLFIYFFELMGCYELLSSQRDWPGQKEENRNIKLYYQKLWCNWIIS